ncbi:hypothetical protein Q2T40_14275 [Winogradskyella maritima]|uniref:Uncharacterized protein n=1 Tax=Winogradskyella maritima TaxID=1517766 RepID=A0ABV8AG83_9FLAO|nr:hypothetical protein [Winogradskyella maritima]
MKNIIIFIVSLPLLVLIFNINEQNRFSQKSKENHFHYLEEKNDTLFRPNYPQGIYFTKEEFINKTPSTKEDFEIKKFKIDSSEAINHSAYFYFKKTNKKIKNVFAVSYKGHLYFQLKAILKNRNKTDRAQTTYIPNAFVRTIIGGNNYLYTEAKLKNQWAKQSLSQLGIGGRIAASKLIKGKGIVWDFKNKEFNIFKSCKDYNDFIKQLSPDSVQKCVNHQPDTFKVREAILKIK